MGRSAAAHAGELPEFLFLWLVLREMLEVFVAEPV